jgi:hypothetical protein
MRASAAALLASASLLPCSALAQSLEIDADGDRVSATSQSQVHADIISVAQAVVPPLAVETLLGSTLRLAANTARASASANAVESRIEDDGVDLSVRSSRAYIGAEGIRAEGALASIAAQSMRDSGVFAQSMQALPVATIGSVEASKLVVSDNVERADGRGNDHLASMALAGSGGLIANLQDQDEASGVRGVLSDMVSLGADRVAQSGLEVTANAQQASAISNSASLGLAVSGPGEAAAPIAAPTTRVDAFGVSLLADHAILSRQLASGQSIAMAGQPGSPTGTRILIGSLDGSDVTIAANRRAALSSGNELRAAIEIDAVAGPASGGSAAVAIDQQVDGQALATATGADHVQVSGLVERGSISVSESEVAARVSGNVAETGLLLRGATIGAASGPDHPPAGTALVGHDGSRTTSAPYALHVDQRAGDANIVARVIEGAAFARFDDGLDASRVTVSNNRQTSDAVANASVGRIEIEAARFVSSADLLSVQMSDADLLATNGSIVAPAGATIATGPWIRDTQLRIAGNVVLSQATANRADNLLVLDAGSAGDETGHAGAAAGTLEAGYGASATLALTSVQRSGSPALRPLVQSDAVGRFSVTGEGVLKRNALLIVDNAQQSSATANSATNALVLDAADPGDTRTALAPSQYGEATVLSNSTMRAVAPGMAVESSVEITGNSNRANASMNEADNRLVASGRFSDPSAPGSVGSVTSGASAQGDHVLSSTQFSAGTASARAVTTLAGSSSGDATHPGLTRGTLAIRDNATLAEAAGNRALNAATFDSTASGGLASSQMNVATIGAYATVQTLIEEPSFGGGLTDAAVRIEGNSGAALARGNLTDNRLTIGGTGHVAGNASAEVRAFSAHAGSPALVSDQTNHGSVTALVSSSGVRVPLNQSGSVIDGSSVTLGRNSLAATAFGNGAANEVAVPDAAGGVSLVSRQTNHAPILAQVSGGSADLAMGTVRNATIMIGNNQVTATATGNVATNIVTGLR